MCTIHTIHIHAYTCIFNINKCYIKQIILYIYIYIYIMCGDLKSVF